MVAALVYVVQFHNDNQLGHLSSFHSWLGVVLLAIYSNNFVLGFFSFALPKDGSSSRLRWAASYLPSHRFVGIATFFTGAWYRSWVHLPASASSTHLRARQRRSLWRPASCRRPG